MEHALQKRSNQQRVSDTAQHTTTTSDLSLAHQTGEYSADQLLHLQRTVGNAAVQRMLSTEGSVVQRVLDQRQILNFRSFLKKKVKSTANIDAYGFAFGDGERVTAQKANWTAVKKALGDFSEDVVADNETITQAAGIVAKIKGSALLIQEDDTVVQVEEVVEETIPDDVDEAYEKFVKEETGCSISDVSDEEEWKRLIVNSLVKGEDSGGAIDFVTVVSKKKQVTVSGLRHMTQKAANRSVWYTREGDHTIHLYALAEHIRGDNTKYRALSRTTGIHGSWTLVSNEAIAGS